MAPNSPVILASTDWRDAVTAFDACDDGPRASCPVPLKVWSQTSPSAKDYETFSPWLYSADLFVPLVALGQEAAWAPTTTRGVWGRVAYWARAPIQFAGWFFTAMVAAILTGLVGRRE